MPYKKGRAGLSSKKMAFPSNLSPLGVCSAVLEVPGSRLVSDCAYTRLGFEHTETQTPLLSTPSACWIWVCSWSAKDKEEKWSGTGSDQALAEL